MSRPRLYRDPIHLQIRYERVVGAPFPGEGGRSRFGRLMQRLIDAPEVQRLRHIRQTGLANLVFHGAEHSRFSHSMGVAHLAGEMYDRICRNMDEPSQEAEEERRLATCVAGLLHDVGHGPFSHTLEEILGCVGVRFDHEVMTLRIIRESGIARILEEIDGTLPEQVVEYIDKEDKGTQPHWSHRVVSSQLDADRLDYLLRDAAAAGLRGHTYDLARLLDMLGHVDGTRIGVERKGLETVEGYLVALDQMYRAVYYHHAVRAASGLLSSVLQRAVMLAKEGDTAVFPYGNGEHPLRLLAEQGDECDLEPYLGLGEFHVWALIEGWSRHLDPVLADLAERLLRRRLPKTIELKENGRDLTYTQIAELRERAKELVRETLPHVDAETAELYVRIDESERTSYKLYDWRANDRPDESIYVIGERIWPLQATVESKILNALKDTRYFSRLFIPPEIADQMNHNRMNQDRMNHNRMNHNRINHQGAKP